MLSVTHSIDLWFNILHSAFKYNDQRRYPARTVLGQTCPVFMRYMQINEPSSYDNSVETKEVSATTGFR